MRRYRILWLGIIIGVWGFPEEVIFELIYQREEYVMCRGSEPWKNPEHPRHYKNSRARGPEY